MTDHIVDANKMARDDIAAMAKAAGHTPINDYYTNGAIKAFSDAQLESFAHLAHAAGAAAEHKRLLDGVEMPEPVFGQSRFIGGADWLPCAPEHVTMVLAAPDAWKGYEVRYLVTLDQLRETVAAAVARERAKHQELDADWLSNVIRQADGSNTMGAGALAEKIVEAIEARGNT